MLWAQKGGMVNADITREWWLTEASIKLESLFEKVGLTYPSIRVSCGLAGKRIGGSCIGECWSDECSADGTREVFISPVLSEPGEVLETLTHELIHACLPHEVKHGKLFKDYCKKIGLEGKATNTYAGEGLMEQLKEIAESIGDYPHAAMSTINRPKQPTRMIKLECPECGYVARTTLKWLAVGVPTCACGVEMKAEVPEG